MRLSRLAYRSLPLVAAFYWIYEISRNGSRVAIGAQREGNRIAWMSGLKSEYFTHAEENRRGLKPRRDSMKCPMHYFAARPTANCKPLTPPPRPKGHRFIGLLPGGRDWASFLTDMARTHGDVVFFKYLCQPACLVSNPELMAEILITRQSAFNKSNMLRSILGSGLVTSEGELWRSERRLILQAFHRACLPEYSRVAVRRTERMLAEWRLGETSGCLGSEPRPAPGRPGRP